MFGAFIILRWKSAALASCGCLWRVTQQAGLLAHRMTIYKKACTQGGLSGGISPDVTHTEGQWKEKGGCRERMREVASENPRHTRSSLINLTRLEATAEPRSCVPRIQMPVLEKEPFAIVPAVLLDHPVSPEGEERACRLLEDLHLLECLVRWMQSTWQTWQYGSKRMHFTEKSSCTSSHSGQQGLCKRRSCKWVEPRVCNLWRAKGDCCCV